MTGASCSEVVRAILRTHCDGSPQPLSVEAWLDFENARPTESERHLYELADKVLSRSNDLLADVTSYAKGASDEIRFALQNPNDESAQEESFRVVEKFVSRIRSYFDLSQRIEQLVPQLLWELCSGPLQPAEQLDRRQSLVRQFARIVDFVLDFDAVKMNTPALQNDFSYYRRSIALRGCRSSASEVELTNSICLFLAAPTPMLTSLSTASLQFVASHPTLPVENTTDTFATIVSVCRFMVDEESVRLSPTATCFCIRVMVGSLILYDHTFTAGAFTKDSAIDLKAVVNAVRNHTTQPQTTALINALRYTTKHYNSAPKSVKTLLE